MTLLNPDAALAPVVDFVVASGSGRICLYGPPGTGKSAFGVFLAQRLDRPALKKRASDLMSPWVGQTEQNLALAFREAEREGAVLILDEADSFLRARDAAQRSWELSQVNELLTQMEDYEGVFVASTNLPDAIDAAALRRFDFKLRFGFLQPEQRARLFALHAERWALRASPDAAAVSEALGWMSTLTPGDFAAIDRRVRALGGNASCGDVLEMLRAELALKPESRRRAMGFV